MSGIFNPAIFNPAIFNTGEESGPTGFLPRDSSAVIEVPDRASATVTVPASTASITVPSPTAEVE